MGIDMKLKKDKCYYKGQHVQGYKVRFKTYDDSEETIDEVNSEVCAMDTSACYASFFRKLNKNDTHLYSVLCQDDDAKYKLTKKEVMRWLSLCKKYNLLPKSIKSKDCYHKTEDGEIQFKLNIFIHKRSQSRTYLHIDSFRHLREDPGFIKAIIYLHDECEINFYAAYVMSSHLNITGTGHHSLLISNTAYSNINKPNVCQATLNDDGAKMNLKAIRGLYKFIHQRKMYDKEDKKIGNGATCWRCNSKLSEIITVDFPIPIKYITDSRVEAIITETDGNKAKRLWRIFTDDIAVKKKVGLKD